MILTIGHSTRSMKDFLNLLQAHGVKRLVDVRTVPRSRHNPQFNQDALPKAPVSTAASGGASVRATTGGSIGTCTVSSVASS